MCCRFRKKLQKFGIAVGITTLISSILSTILFAIVGIGFILAYTNEVVALWGLILGIVIIVLGILISWTLNIVVLVMSKTFRVHSNILIHHHSHLLDGIQGNLAKLTLTEITEDIQYLVDVGLVKVQEIDKILNSEVVDDAKLVIDLVKEIKKNHQKKATKVPKDVSQADESETE